MDRLFLQVDRKLAYWGGESTDAFSGGSGSSGRNLSGMGGKIC
jgi:hypothetical protein